VKKYKQTFELNAIVFYPFLLKIFRLVIETLKEVEKDRKCYRMIGGVLVERTVGEVLPALEHSRDQVSVQ
jgi:chaperonin cofactor prefoldin